MLDASTSEARGAARAVDAPAPVAPGPPDRGRRGRRGAGRADIQGLRAIAVALVVAYHLRPDLLPGGFIGVDVFLVISGFLIVGSLGREATASGTISLRSFYARRIRRLLPASTVVLLATTGATLLLMPQSRWLTTAKGVVASALEVQNWALAAGSGYGAATASVSPLQHYWSLAVEEQFYIVTPLLLLLVVRFAGRSPRSRALAIAGLVAVVTALSFVHSVGFSRTHHDIAYYATTTRMWELGLGGLLALVAPHLPPARFARGLAGWAGLAAIGVGAVRLSTTVAFPGWVAVVPVVGSVLVILAGTTAPDRALQPGGAGRLLGIRPLAYVGDVSYSLYLWHWPVIVFFVFRAGRAPGAVDCAILCVACLALAALSTRFVERPFRSAPGARDAAAPTGGHAAPRRWRHPFRLAIALVALSLAAGVAPWVWMDHRQAAVAAVRPDSGHPGGSGVLPDRLPRPAAHVIPDPAVAAQDGPLVYRHDGCGTYDPRKDDPQGCVFGDAQGAVTVALVGDSHAAQYSSVLARIAGARHVALHTMVRDGCPFTGAPMLMKGVPNSDCADANRLTRDELLRLHPRVVVVSAMQPTGYRTALQWTWSSEDLVAGYRELWSSLTRAGIRVLVLRDNPMPDYVDPECVERYGSASSRCGMSRADAITHRPDPEVRAARGLPGVTVLDLTDHFCNRTVCPGVIGNVLVYRDNHLTDTFTLTLRPVLSKALDALL